MARSAVRVAVIGGRESGKSYAADWVIGCVLQRYASRALIYCTQPESPLRGVEVTPATCRDHLAAPRWVFRPPTPWRAVVRLALALRRADPSRGLVLVPDELSGLEITRQGQWACPEMIEALQTVRGISLVGTTQRPNGMPLALRELADVYLLFRVTQKDALTRLRDDGIPDSVLGSLPALPDRKFVPVTPGRGCITSARLRELLTG